ncbi:MAG: PKD domain-containing protein [Candidatus Paceibacterota bacterium]
MKYIRLLFILVLYATPAVTFAELTITEIMYDPEGSDTNREWIEVYNAGDDVVIEGGSGNTWRLYEESTSGALNKRTLNFETGAPTMTLPHNTYTVIAKNIPAFRQDHPEYDGLLLFSAFSLTNNEGRVLTIRDSDAIEKSSPLLYVPLPEASGTGASLQLQQGGLWIAGLPTPGEINTTEVFSLHEKDLDENDVGDDFLELESGWPFTREKLYLDAGENRRVFVDELVTFNGDVRFKNGDKVRGNSPTWAFGDGEGGRGIRMTHAYRHPGVYRAVLRAEHEGRLYQDSFLVHVIEVSDITIGEHSSEFIEITNTSNYEVELSNWTLRSEDNVKKLAHGTFVLPLSSIIVPFVSLRGQGALYGSTGKLVERTTFAPEPFSNDEVYTQMLRKLEHMLGLIQKGT